MAPMKELSLLEQIRRERLVKARTRHLRLALLVDRHLIEADLEARRLQYFTSFPGFDALSEETRALVTFPFERDRMTFLTRAVRGMKRRNAAEDKLAELLEGPAGGGE